MKTFIYRTLAIIYFSLFAVLFSFADPPGPPPPGGDPGLGGTPVGAPISDGWFILLALGIGYGLYKYYEILRDTREKKQQV